MAELRHDASPAISDSDWRTCLRVLETVAGEPEAAVNSEPLERLIARLYKRARKARRKQSLYRRAAHDRRLVRQTARVRLEDGNSVTTESPFAADEFEPLQAGSRRCYICKGRYRHVHRIYHLLCPDCARFNSRKRRQAADLSGRFALVTGGRIKIGFQTALKLLRCGAHVNVSTRYPTDAARRYAGEPDFDSWRERLTIRRADFRDVRALLRLIERLDNELPALDVLVNNAAQSVRRAPEYEARLARIEAESELSPNQRRLLAVDIVASRDWPRILPTNGGDAVELPAFDRHGEVVDIREQNSWTYRLDDVQPLELLEVLLVNANAPALLTAGLKPLLQRSSFPDRYVINVTGLDGRFARRKSARHPHVNMGKAALNMLTRTAAGDYARGGIFMNSVDTGWITHEGSFTRRNELRARGFVPPLDEIDGAARILDPIIRGVHGTPTFGQLYRHYEPAEW